MALLTGVFGSGTISSRPTATAANLGYCYFASDVVGGTYYQNQNGSTWTQLGPGLNAAAMQQISRQTVTPSVAATIAFNTIPGTYNELALRLVGRGDAAATSVNVFMQVNGDSGANYDYQNWHVTGSSSSGTGSGAVAQTSTLVGWLSAASAPASIASTTMIRVPEYAGTTWQKCWTSEGNNETAQTVGGVWVGVNAGYWRNAAAITSITLSLSSGNFAVGSVATLYGIL